MVRALVGLAVVLGGAGLWVLKLMAAEVVRREYDSWAPALARALVHIGCRMHSARADEWRAELTARQAEGAAGIDYAVSVGLSGLRFAATAPQRFATSLTDRITDRVAKYLIGLLVEDLQLRVDVLLLAMSELSAAEIDARVEQALNEALDRRPRWSPLRLLRRVLDRD